MSDMSKVRLDVELVNQTLAPTRSKAQQLIKEGAVSVDGKVQKKAGHMVSEEQEIVISSAGDAVLNYVGRGALKLEFALEKWQIDASGRTCLDIGASTGGFTDVLLKKGAKLVVAVDVGKNQLAETLRASERVISMEETDIRKFELVNPYEKGFDLIAIDVSFISVTKIIDCVFKLANKGCHVVILIKPQFELSQKKRLKNGVVKSEKDRKTAVNKVLQTAEESGLKFCGIEDSPILGGSGNKEYVAYFKV